MAPNQSQEDLPRRNDVVIRPELQPNLDGFYNSAGKVLRVVLVNFLNHDHLIVDMGPRLNFIFGLNGHGKSAIVQAIAVALGAIGHAIGRDACLYKFIKDHHLATSPGFARVQVILSNDGPRAYKQDEYGKYIIVTRTITKQNTTLQLGGEHMRRRISKFKDLFPILSHLKIDITNPVTYMTQESSKSFFSSCTPQGLFNYYSKVAGLDELESNICTEKQNLEECKHELKARKAVLQPASEQLEQLKTRIASFEQKLQEWSQAKDNFKLATYKNLCKVYDAAKDNLDKLMRTDPNAGIAKHKADVEQLNESTQQYKDAVDALLEESLNMKQRKRALQDQVASLTEVINGLETNIACRLDPNSQENPNATGTQILQQRIQQELQLCKRCEQQASEMAKKLQEKCGLLERDVADCKQNLADAETELNELMQDNNCKGVDDNPRTNRGHGEPKARIAHERGIIAKRYYKYDVEAIYSAVEAHKRKGFFKSGPIGPVGEYILLRGSINTDWRVACIVEKHLQRILRVWFVANEEDRVALANIFIKVGVPSSANVDIMKTNLDFGERKRRNSDADKDNHTPFQGTFECLPRNYSDNVDRYKMILSSFLSTGEMPSVVLHVLFDNYNIARILVVRDQRELVNVLNDESLDIVGAYTLSGLDHGKRVNGSTVYLPNCSLNPHVHRIVKISTNEKSSPRAHHDSLDEDLNASRCGQQTLQDAITRIKRNLRETTSNLESCKGQLSRAEADYSRWLKRRTQLEADLYNELNEDDEEGGDDSSATTDESEDVVDESIDSADPFLRQLKKKVKQRQRIEAALVELQESLDDVLRRLSQAKLERHRNTTRINSIKNAMRLLSKSTSSHAAKIAAAEAKTLKAKQAVEKKQVELERDGIDYTGGLPAKDPEEYNRIAQISKELLKRFSVGTMGIEESLQELKQRKIDMERDLNNRQKLYEETLANFTCIKNNFGKRCRRFDECKRKIEKRAKRTFCQVLDAVTGYNGSLVFNDVERTLDIQIHNGQQSYQRQHVATSLKTLSGGEQSSIQLSLLQSLAIINYTPLHMFDEIDVYMDESSRIKNIESLKDFCKSNPDRQLILVTPHFEFAQVFQQHDKNDAQEMVQSFYVTRPSSNLVPGTSGNSTSGNLVITNAGGAGTDDG